MRPALDLRENIVILQLLGEETICREGKHDFCDVDHVCNGQSSEVTLIKFILDI